MRTWRTLAFILAGMALVAASVYVAQVMRLRESFTLDWRGAVIQGTAEQIDAERYRLRYELATGINSQTVKGKLPLFQHPPKEGMPITLVYDPQNPANFQARGKSYIATAIVGALFLSGMACVLYARRKALRAKLAAASPAPVSNGERRKTKGKAR